MVIMVLLKVAFTCATPDAMFLRSRRRTRVASLPILDPFVTQRRSGRAHHPISHLISAKRPKSTFGCACRRRAGLRGMDCLFLWTLLLLARDRFGRTLA